MTKAKIIHIEQSKLKIMHENRVLRICGPKKKEAARGWIRLHKQKLHKLYASSNIIKEIKSRRVK
jgi:hypothetical protein